MQPQQAARQLVVAQVQGLQGAAVCQGLKAACKAVVAQVHMDELCQVELRWNWPCHPAA
jgi:hypothetical protein